MIILQIEKYCHNCPDFEPAVEKNTYSNFDIDYCEERRYADTLITCKYCNRCAGQMAYLKKQKEKKDG